MESYEREIEVAIEAAREAAKLILEVYARNFEVDYKNGEEPVTEADKRANELLVGKLRQAFPSDAIVAEETAPKDPEELHRRLQSERVWFVDPIDGTWEFVDRNGEFSVMIGLAVHGRAQLGVVLRPTTGELAVGVIGLGTWLVEENGQRTHLHVSKVDDPSQARLLLSRSHHSERLEQVARSTHASEIVPCGSVGVKAMRLARGTEDMYVLLPKVGGARLWDTCAPEVLIRAAGGKATDVRGRPLDYRTREVTSPGGLVASNGLLHDTLLRAVRDIPTLDED